MDKASRTLIEILWWHCVAASCSEKTSSIKYSSKLPFRYIQIYKNLISPRVFVFSNSDLAENKNRNEEQINGSQDSQQKQN